MFYNICVFIWDFLKKLHWFVLLFSGRWCWHCRVAFGNAIKKKIPGEKKEQFYFLELFYCWKFASIQTNVDQINTDFEKVNIFGVIFFYTTLF